MLRRRGILFSESEIHVDHQSAFRIEAGIQTACLQGSVQEQASTKEKHERERNLRHDENVTRSEEAAETAGMGRLAHLLFQVADQIEPRRFEGRPEAEEESREQA